MLTEDKELSEEGTQAAKEGTLATKEGTQATKEGTQATKEGIQAMKEGTRATKEELEAEGITHLYQLDHKVIQLKLVGSTIFHPHLYLTKLQKNY